MKKEMKMKRKAQEVKKMNSNMKEMNLNEIEQVSGGDVQETAFPGGLPARPVAPEKPPFVPINNPKLPWIQF